MADTAELLKRSHAGDKEARDRLVMENAGLVWSIVKRFAGRGTEVEDLFQIGNNGIMKAIDRFDTEIGLRSHPDLEFHRFRCHGWRRRSCGRCGRG